MVGSSVHYSSALQAGLGHVPLNSSMCADRRWGVRSGQATEASSCLSLLHLLQGLLSFTLMMPALKSYTPILETAGACGKEPGDLGCGTNSL